MNKKMLSVLTALVTSVSFGINIYPNVAYAEETETFKLSELFYKVYPENLKSSEVDYSLFDKFLKYSLLITDKDNLSPEQMDLCQKIFMTERTYMTVTCNNARESLKASPKRISLNDKKSIAAFADLQLIPYNLTVVEPDIDYYYYKGPGGDVSSYCEYWIDNNGIERLIHSSETSDAIYEITFRSKPNPFELDDLMDSRQKMLIDMNVLDGDEIKCADGAIKYRGKVNTKYYSTDPENEVFASDIWKYELLEDGSAIIIDCNLPKYTEAELITETVTLPSELDGHTVYGFYDGLKGTGITKLVIPESYKYINLLYGMDYLTELEINSPELILRSSSIASCSKLEKITLNVESIEEHAVLGCNSLHTILIDNATGISCDAFSNIESLCEVKLPEKGLKYIGQDAFTGTKIKELLIPSDVEIAGMLKSPYLTPTGELIDPLIDENIKIANDDCVILSYYNTEGQCYATANGCKFSPMDNLEYGDLNSDGSCNIADLVLLQKWMLSDQNSNLSNWEYADFSKNGKIDITDFCLMKNNLVK